MTESIPSPPPPPVEREVEIVGVGGRFPESRNIHEFWQNLTDHVDMVTEKDDRWPTGVAGLPSRMGTYKKGTADKFDFGFFQLSPFQANNMSPQMRLLLEVTYEAIQDAGFTLDDVKGTNTGVFVGSGTTDGYCLMSRTLDMVEKSKGYQMTGSLLCMLANRISFFFDFKGPSEQTDTACSSSLVAFNRAVREIECGHCDYAVVAGVQELLRPMFAKGFMELSMLSKDGMCQTFDKKGSGYVRAEANCVLFLARKGLGKRPYCRVLSTGTNQDGYTDKGITYPNGLQQEALLRQIYREAGVDPTKTSYVEMHGTGTVAGDSQEGGALDRFFRPSETHGSDLPPLKVGSVKSNMGHSEAAAAACALAKVCLCFRHGLLPANLHFTEPNPAVEGLEAGRLHLVHENTPFEGGQVLVSSFGFGGTNAAAILEGYSPKKEEWERQSEGDDVLVLAGSRTEEGASALKKEVVEEHKVTLDVAQWLSGTAEKVSAAPFRSFIQKNADGKVSSMTKKAPSAEPGVYWVFPGMGCHYVGMARQLFRLPVFAESMQRAAKIVEETCVEQKMELIDIMSMINSDDPNVYEEPIAANVVLAAMQMALVDLLHASNVPCHGIVGHSVGEVAAAYASGVIDAKQTVDLAFARGMCLATDLPTGAMASTGLTWDELEPTQADGATANFHGVYRACQNSATNSTVSGTPEAVAALTAELESREVFVKKVNSSDRGFHCPLIMDAVPEFRTRLDKIIPEPKSFPKHWFSTSQMGSPTGQYKGDVDYFVTNVTAPVMFRDAMLAMKKSHDEQFAGRAFFAVEVCPNSIFRSLICASVPEAKHLTLAHKKAGDDVALVHTGIGSLFINGVEGLAPPVTGVEATPRTLPYIRSQVSWNHEKQLSMPTYHDQLEDEKKGAGFAWTVDVKDADTKYMLDHCINKNAILPATGYLYHVWRALATQTGKDQNKMRVEFRDVELVRATPLSEDDIASLDIRISTTSTAFEVSQEGEVLVKGHVRDMADDSDKDTAYVSSRLVAAEEDDAMVQSFADKDAADASAYMHKKHIFHELGLRGYGYGTNFQLLTKAEAEEGRVFEADWIPKLDTDKAEEDGEPNQGCWVAFMDALLQATILGCPGSDETRELRLPTKIGRLVVDAARAPRSKQSVSLTYNPLSGWLKSRMVFLEGLITKPVAKATHVDDPLVEVMRWSPLRSEVDIPEELRVYGDVIARYITHKVKERLDAAYQVDEKIEAVRVNLRKLYDQEWKKYEAQPAPTADELQRFSDSKWLVLGLARHMFESVSVDTFLANPRDAMMSFPGYQALYSQDPWLSFQERHCLHHTVDLLRQEFVQEECVNILEVGVGTGGLTSNVLPLLARKVGTIDYHATDISRSFFPKLKDNFSDYGNVMHLSRWDASQPWSESGNGELAHRHLVVADNVIHATPCIDTTIDNVAAVIAPRGFFLLREIPFAHPWMTGLWCWLSETWDWTKTNGESRDFGCLISMLEWEKRLTAKGFKIVYSRDDASGSALILAQKLEETPAAVPVVKLLGEQEVDSVKVMQATQARLAEAEDADGNLLFVATEKAVPGYLGFLRSIRKEPGLEKMRGLLLDRDYTEEEIQAFAAQSQLAITHVRDGVLGFQAHDPVTPARVPVKVGAEEVAGEDFIRTGLGWKDTVATPDAVLNIRTLGDLDSFEWCQNTQSQLSKEQYRVHFASLNFKDVMIGTGRLDQRDKLGIEFSGVCQQTGKRVMGVADGCLGSLTSNAEVLLQCPDDWTLEQAVTVPVAYMTVIYALCIRANIRKGQTILVHSGSGATGSAAISIALSKGLKVLTTVGSDAKRKYVLERFPQLCEEDVGYSRSQQFEEWILEKTNGRGVDVLLNAQSGQLLKAGMRLVAKWGHHVEIGKYDMKQDTPIGMAWFEGNKTFHGIDFNHADILEHDMDEVKRIMKEFMAQGVVMPLPTKTFPYSQASDAFRYFSSGKHIGKVVVDMREPSDEKEPDAEDLLPQHVAKVETWFSDDGVFLVTGGLGGFGLELVEWMVARGARNFVLTSRSGAKNGEQRYRLRLWRQRGVNVKVSTLNVVYPDQALKLVQDIGSRLQGVFHLTLVLNDSLHERMTPEAWKDTVACKSDAAGFLDRAVREVGCPELKHFVLFSSITSAYGNLGQSNYTYANCAMESLCQRRTAENCPGSSVAVQWGVIGDVGYVQKTTSRSRNMAHGIVGEILPQSIESCLSTLDKITYLNEPVVTTWCPIPRTSWKASSASGKKSSAGQGSVTDVLVAKIGKILGYEVDELPGDKTLQELGMDSLMSTQIRLNLKNVGVVVAAKNLSALTMDVIRTEVTKANSS